MLDPKRERGEAFDDEGVPTETSLTQKSVEDLVKKHQDVYLTGDAGAPRPVFFRDAHISFVKDAILGGFGANYKSLDASQSWLHYWGFNALDLLRFKLTPATQTATIETLSQCQNKDIGGGGGGYCGGPYQEPHVLSTYAIVRALCAIGTEEAYKSIDRAGVLRFLRSVKEPDGSFLSQVGGETDMRCVYGALSTAALLNILTPDLLMNAAEWIASCQTYEGGFGGFPGNEAHGGYTYCALAALAAISRTDVIRNFRSLVAWLASCQMGFEGGFHGRQNKLVDSCYSFWQGAGAAIAGNLIADPHMYDSHEAVVEATKKKINHADNVMSPDRLIEYVLVCAQDERGGLRDKPGKYAHIHITLHT